MRTLVFFVMSAVLIAVAVQSPAVAEDTAEAESELRFLNEEPVGIEDLEGARGGEEVVLRYNNNDLEAHSENNQVIDTITGANTISGDAFSGLNGLSSVIQNTGNNVIIQDSTMVTIELHAAP